MSGWWVEGTVDLRQTWHVSVDADTPEQAEEKALELLYRDADTIHWDDTSDAELLQGTEEVWDVVVEPD